MKEDIEVKHISITVEVHLLEFVKFSYEHQKTERENVDHVNIQSLYEAKTEKNNKSYLHSFELSFCGVCVPPLCRSKTEKKTQQCQNKTLKTSNYRSTECLWAVGMWGILICA